MSVSEERLREILPPEYDVDATTDLEDSFVIHDKKGNGAEVKIGEEDGNDLVEIAEWAGTTERVFPDQQNETETFFDYKWVEEIFSEELIDYELQALSALEEGYNEAYSKASKKEQAEVLIDAAESALNFFKEEGLDVDDYILRSSDDSKTLGSARLMVDDYRSYELDFTHFEDPEWSTSAAYISSLVLLQESNQKPTISTGYGYKPQHVKRETADIDLVQAAQDITDNDEYDFFN